MGASGHVFWRRIGLPILAPSLISVFIMLFANAMGTYATAWALVGGSANLVTIRIGELHQRAMCFPIPTLPMRSPCCWSSASRY